MVIILLISGSFLILKEGVKFHIMAAILLIIGVIFDYVDGNIARFNRKKNNKTGSGFGGMYLDRLGHFISSPVLFFCLGLSVYFEFGYSMFLYLSPVIALSMTSFPSMQKDSVFMRYLRPQVKSGGDYKKSIVANKPLAAALNENIRKEKKWSKKIVQVIWKFFSEIIMPGSLIGMVAVAVIMDLILSPFNIFGYSVNFKLIVFMLYGLPLFLRLPFSISRHYKNLEKL